MEIKGAIFDLDGTLLDSLWVWAEIDRRFLNKRGIEVPPWYAEAISAMTFRDVAIYTIETFGLNESPDDVMKEWMDMSHRIYATEIKLKPKAKEFLLALKSKGIKLGIATSSAEDLYMPALKNNGIDDLFSVIMDTSTTRSKAFPDIFIAVADRMGLKTSECVVFDDLPAALRSAKQGGCVTVAVHDEHTKDFDEANYSVKSFDELLGFII